jgi:hypothetical protein
MMTTTAPQTPPFLPHALSFLNPVVVNDLARFGNAADGGYVLPASRVRDVDAVLSFGVSNDWTLEEDLVGRNPGLVVHAYDHTVGGRRFAERTALEMARLALLQSSWGQVRSRLNTYFGYRRFFSGGNRRHFRERIYNRAESPHDATIDKVFSRIPDKKHVFLKMDIEGAEYRVLPDVLRRSDKVDLLAIEFHDTEPLRDVFVKRVGEILDHFVIVHLHGNNWGGVADDGLPDALEATFVNKRFADPSAPRRGTLPVPGLDVPNDPSKPDFPLNFPA